MNDQDLIDDVDAIVDDIDPDRVGEIVQQHELGRDLLAGIDELMKRVTVELKARLTGLAQ